LIHLVETNLISNHIKQMLSKGFDNLIDENRLKSVGLLYDLLLPIGINGINDLREAFGKYIKVRRTNNCSMIYARVYCSS
jgi:cullin 4